MTDDDEIQSFYIGSPKDLQEELIASLFGDLEGDLQLFITNNKSELNKNDLYVTVLQSVLIGFCMRALHGINEKYIHEGHRKLFMDDCKKMIEAYFKEMETVA